MTLAVDHYLQNRFKYMVAQCSKRRLREKKNVDNPSGKKEGTKPSYSSAKSCPVTQYNPNVQKKNQPNKPKIAQNLKSGESKNNVTKRKTQTRKRSEKSIPARDIAIRKSEGKQNIQYDTGKLGQTKPRSTSHKNTGISRYIMHYHSMQLCNTQNMGKFR